MHPTCSRLSKANLSKLVFLNCNDELLVQLWTQCSDKNVFLYSMNCGPNDKLRYRCRFYIVLQECGLTV